jgi:hypothetical protein
MADVLLNRLAGIIAYIGKDYKLLVLNGRGAFAFHDIKRGREIPVDSKMGIGGCGEIILAVSGCFEGVSGRSGEGGE